MESHLSKYPIVRIEGRGGSDRRPNDSVSSHARDDVELVPVSFGA